MKKKILVIALVLVVALSGAFAANNWGGAAAKNTMGIGLNLGTNTGLGMKFGMGKFDVLANIGLGDFRVGDPTEIAGDVAVSYEVADFDFGKGHHMPLTVGGGLNTTIVVGSNATAFELGIMIPVGIEYTIPNTPVNFYLHLAPGLGLDFAGSSVGLSFDFDANLGVPPSMSQIASSFLQFIETL